MAPPSSWWLRVCCQSTLCIAAAVAWAAAAVIAHLVRWSTKNYSRFNLLADRALSLEE
jgi:hypothetical protein